MFVPGVAEVVRRDGLQLCRRFDAQDKQATVRAAGRKVHARRDYGIGRSVHDWMTNSTAFDLLRK
jgi:hypothetical protein